MNDLDYVEAALSKQVYMRKGEYAFLKETRENPRELVEEYAEEFDVEIDDFKQETMELLEKRDSKGIALYREALETIADRVLMRDEQ